MKKIIIFISILIVLTFSSCSNTSNKIYYYSLTDKTTYEVGVYKSKEENICVDDLDFSKVSSYTSSGLLYVITDTEFGYTPFVWLDSSYDQHDNFDLIYNLYQQKSVIDKTFIWKEIGDTNDILISSNEISEMVNIGTYDSGYNCFGYGGYEFNVYNQNADIVSSLMVYTTNIYASISLESSSILNSKFEFSVVKIEGLKEELELLIPQKSIGGLLINDNDDTVYSFAECSVPLECTPFFTRDVSSYEIS